MKSCQRVCQNKEQQVKKHKESPSVERDYKTKTTMTKTRYGKEYNKELQYQSERQPT